MDPKQGDGPRWPITWPAAVQTVAGVIGVILLCLVCGNLILAMGNREQVWPW